MSPTRKPAAPPRRSCRLLEVEGSKVLTIAVWRGRKVTETYYHLTAIRPDFGEAAFELAKSPLDGEEVYHVCLDGEHSTCGCLGFLKWNKCKHVDSLAKLRELGRV